MKTFLIKIFFLSIILLTMLVFITISNRIIFRYGEFLTLNDNVSSIILGDSHTKYSINDQILTNRINLSDDADSYFYSFQKLKQVHYANEHIDTLFLAFSQHNIDKSIEKQWLLNSKHLKTKLKIYFFLLSLEDFFFLLKHMPGRLLSVAFSQIQYPYHVIKHSNIYGGYEPLERDILQKQLQDLAEKNNPEADQLFVESPIEKKYLRKIIQYCQDNGISLVLINTPLHYSLQEKQDHLYECYENHFSDTHFLDFSKVQIVDAYFADLVHLNTEGATFFSEFIKNRDLLNIEKAKAAGFAH